MTLRSTLAPLSLAFALTATSFLTGCGNETDTKEAQVAEKATNINPENATTKTVKQTRDVIVEKDTKVKDAKTGEILSDTKESTPVKIVETKEEKTNVKVDVGDTKTSVAPAK